MISMTNIDPRQFELFVSLFRGRTDVWARYLEKNGRSGYSPAYESDWDEFMAHKNRGGSLKDFANKRLIPLTPDIVKKHLIGQQVVGVYPILPDNTSCFLAADFDGNSWKEDVKAFINAANSVGLSGYLERSRSGKGAMFGFSFPNLIHAGKSRQIGLELIRKAFHVSESGKEVSFDRLFQAKIILANPDSVI